MKRKMKRKMTSQKRLDRLSYQLIAKTGVLNSGLFM